MGTWGLGRLRSALTGTGIPTVAEYVAPGWFPPSEQPGAEATRQSADEVVAWAALARASVLDDFASITAAARDGVHAALTHPFAVVLGAPSRVPAPIATWAQVDHQGRPVVQPPAQPTEEERASLAYDPSRVYLAQWASRLAAAADQGRQETDTAQVRRSSGPSSAWHLPWTRPVHTHPITLEEWQTWCTSEGKLDPSLIPSRVSQPSSTISTDSTLDYLDQGIKIGHAVRAQIFTRGVEGSARFAVWPYVLGVFPWDSTLVQRESIQHLLETEYSQWTTRAHTLLKQQVTNSKVSSSATGTTKDATDPNESNDTSPSDPAPPTEDPITYPTLRSPGSSAQDGDDIELDLDVMEERRRIRLDCERTDREHVLFRTSSTSTTTLPEEGQSPVAGPAPSNVHIGALGAILLALVMWDARATADEDSGKLAPSGPAAKLGGYAQGVSDICAVLYVSLCPPPTTSGEEWSVPPGLEALTFGCLRAVLTSFGWSAPHRRDQLAMTSALASLRGMLRTGAPDTYKHLVRLEADNLFFAYRWLLVTFKREFALSDTCLVWETIWAADSELASAVSLTANPPLANQQRGPGAAASFSLVLAFALIVRETPALAQLKVFDETLHYFNSLVPATGHGSQHDGAATDLLSRASHAAHDQPGLWPPPPLPLTRPSTNS